MENKYYKDELLDVVLTKDDVWITDKIFYDNITLNLQQVEILIPLLQEWIKDVKGT